MMVSGGMMHFMGKEDSHLKLKGKIKKELYMKAYSIMAFKSKKGD